MNNYFAAFIHGLRTYCDGFPADANLWEGWQNASINTELWTRAENISLGAPAKAAKPVAFASVFRQLCGESSATDTTTFQPLGISREQIFPEKAGNMEELLRQFREEWQSRLLALNNDAAREYSLLFLCKKYLSNIGCCAEYPHISLYEHLKVSAAIADSLQRGAGDRFLLVGVGIDNIQDFCYDIVSSKAAKSLKGRSFFLQMLMDTVCQDIISHPDIQATQGHILYARGGKAFLLLPDTPAVRAGLDAIHRELIEQIWKRHRLGLYIFLQYTEFSAATTDQVSVWRTLEEQIRREKNRKYNRMLVDAFDQFFTPIEEGLESTPELNKQDGQKQFCRVTGQLIENATRKHNNLEMDPKEDPIWVTEEVILQSELGTALRESSSIYTIQRKKAGGVQTDENVYTGSTRFLSLPETQNIQRKYPKTLLNYELVQERRLNSTDWLDEGLAYTFYGGDDQAKKENEEIKSFEELAGELEAGEGFRRLGVGRMDVDNLSKLAKAAQTSLALNATFSSRLDLFLSGYVNNLRENIPEAPDFMNIVFSGGDDLLIVGRWDLTLEFMAALRREFSAFTQTETITLSAGMVVVTPKYPIAKSVQLAGNAEDRAKDFPHKGAEPQKNALCLLGETISWNEEWDFVRYFSERLETWVNRKDSGISASLIFKIYQFYAMQKGSIPNWRWLSVWYFKQVEKPEYPFSTAAFRTIKTFIFSGLWETPDTRFKCHPDRALLLLSLGAKLFDYKNRSKNVEKYENQEIQ